LIHHAAAGLILVVQVSSELRTITNTRLLTDVGELEQDLMFGEKTSKELADFLAGSVGVVGFS
jgi:syntaxin-binding protein 1